MVKVLIVDDESISALTLSLYLSDQGYEVLTANSGKEALRLCESSLPDILLSDWKLQDEIDGLELIRRLSPRNVNMKSIIISGLSAEYVPPADDVTTKIFRFLTKPCGIDVVLSTVEDAVRAGELKQ